MRHNYVQEQIPILFFTHTLTQTTTLLELFLLGVVKTSYTFTSSLWHVYIHVQQKVTVSGNISVRTGQTTPNKHCERVDTKDSN